MLQTQDQHTVSGQLLSGQMLWFNEERGSGLIRTDAGERVFVDRDGFLPGEAPVGRCAGKQVSFRCEPASGEYGQRAVSVVVIEEDESRRARLRRPNATSR